MRKMPFYLLLLLGAVLVQPVNAQKQLTINTAQPKQTIDGFGGSIAYYENWLVAHPKRSMIYDCLFKDLGLSIFRIKNNYYNEGAFNQGIADLKSIVVEGRKRSSFDIMISSWSPPGKYKSNGKPANDETMASLATDANGNFVYGDFAKWWYNSLLSYKTNGIDAKYISLQNEPNWGPGYEGCVFMPQEQTVYDKKLAKNVKIASYAKAFNAVYDTLAKYNANLKIAPKMIGPEVLGIENAWSGKPSDYTKYMDMSKCYAVAHHLYTGVDPATMLGNFAGLNNTYPNKPKMQTEYSDKEWFTLSQIIQSSLVVENVSAYLVWDLFWPGSDFLDLENPWTSGSWVNPNGFKAGTKFYAFKQFASFIKPGWIRVTTSNPSATIKPSAFMSPEGQSMSIVVINTGSTLDSISIASSAFAVSSGKIYRTSDTEKCVLVGNYSGGTIKLPVKSITTITLQGQLTSAEMKKLPESEPMVYPNPFNQETLLNLKDFPREAQIAIYNLSGQILYQEKVQNSNSVKIGSELSQGVYILKVTDGGKQKTIKIIKQ
ncbi:MAG: T9SS type A sorting domain-containing protein [Bacteroidia bacterium]